MKKELGLREQHNKLEKDHETIRSEHSRILSRLAIIRDEQREQKDRTRLIKYLVICLVVICALSCSMSITLFAALMRASS